MSKSGLHRQIEIFNVPDITMSENTNTAADPESNFHRSAIRDFIIEFLGCLVPGIAFLFSTIPAFFIPVGIVAFTFLPPSSVPVPALKGTLPVSVGTIMFLIVPALASLLVFSYIVGHLFYRQDPKNADKASFLRIPRHEGLDGMVRPIDGGGVPVEFPYHFLKSYLLDRGLIYLAEHVPWNAQNWKRRCKHFANALKIRIHIESPHHAVLLARNEAHIRLSSSTWYVCKTLITTSVAGLFIYSLAAILSALVPGLPKLHFSCVAVFPIAILITSWLVKWAIERALHYQREREILFILETAYWLKVTGKVSKIFEGLEEKDYTASQ